MINEHDNVERTAAALKKYQLTDLGNAERFVDRHKDSVRFVAAWNRWFVWDGARWARDERLEVVSLAKDTVRAIYAEAERAATEDERKAIAAHAIRSENRSRIDALLALARALPPIAVLPDDFDRAPYLLNCVNGEIDLRTGKLSAHNREHMITKLAPIMYDRAAQAPLWDRVLATALPDPEVRIFLQRLAGYSATGIVDEHVLPFLFGSGANGKSTVLETIREILGEGEYARVAQPKLLLARKQDPHEEELAELRGARLVSTVEAGEGQAWDEPKLKAITGGDTITARHLYGHRFSFAPTFKVWVAANFKPRVSGADEGIWRRIRLVPFTTVIPEAERDPKLRDKLREELPGILRWMVEGAVAWHEARERGLPGLKVPAAVREATAAYRAAEDVVGIFLAECTVADPEKRVDQASLYDTYAAWAGRNGERAPMSAKAFFGKLDDRGFTRKSSNGRRWVLGLTVLQHDIPPQ